MSPTRIQGGLALAGLGLVAAACLALAPNGEPMTPDAPSTPDEAIKMLMDGNARYVAGSSKAINPPSDRPALAAGQAPFAAIVRCADSRVAPEIVFDQPLGALFVNGVAGNIVTPEIIASFEFSVAVLGAKVIVIMGHSSCGAVQAAISHRNTSAELPGSLPMLVAQIIVPCTLDANPNDVKAYEDEAIKCNANQGVAELIARSPVLAEAVKKGDLKIIAGVQDLATGKFTVTKK